MNQPFARQAPGAGLSIVRTKPVLRPVSAEDADAFQQFINAAERTGHGLDVHRSARVDAGLVRWRRRLLPAT
jgi:hypothetical protein